MSISNERIFLRDVKFETLNKTLLFYVTSFGNVNCSTLDSSLVLMKYIEKRGSQNDSWLKGQKVVELGAGLGCVGIIAACFGADVVLTDLPEIIPQVEKTIELNRNAWVNSGKLTATALTWGAERNSMIDIIRLPDILLLSDCVIYDELSTQLLETIKYLATDYTEIIICQDLRDSEKRREVWKEFIGKLQEAFAVSKISLNEQNESYCSQDIFLFKAKKKVK